MIESGFFTSLIGFFIVGLHLRWKEMNLKTRDFLDTQIYTDGETNSSSPTQGEIGQTHGETDQPAMQHIVLHECQVR